VGGATPSFPPPPCVTTLVPHFTKSGPETQQPKPPPLPHICRKDGNGRHCPSVILFLFFFFLREITLLGYSGVSWPAMPFLRHIVGECVQAVWVVYFFFFPPPPPGKPTCSSWPVEASGVHGKRTSLFTSRYIPCDRVAAGLCRDFLPFLSFPVVPIVHIACPGGGRLDRRSHREWSLLLPLLVVVSIMERREWDLVPRDRF